MDGDNFRTTVWFNCSAFAIWFPVRSQKNTKNCKIYMDVVVTGDWLKRIVVVVVKKRESNFFCS